MTTEEQQSAAEAARRSGGKRQPDWHESCSLNVWNRREPFHLLCVQPIGIKLREWMRNERREGRKISAYGASTKGNTLLQVFGLDHTMIRSAAARNPERCGKYTVGTWILTVSEAEARARPDNFLVLLWHFIDEIQIRERNFLTRGGKLVAPLPNLRMITSTAWSAIA